jgi:hypothetical protein
VDEAFGPHTYSRCLDAFSMCSMEGP